MKRSLWAGPYILWIALFTLIPLAIVCFYAFTSADGTGTAFSLANFQKAFDPMYLGILGRSLWYAFLATVICLLLGYPIAAILSNRKLIKKSSTLIMLFVLPMWMNFLLRTYAMMNILDSSGFIVRILSFLGFGNVQLLYTPFAVVLGLVYDYLPFMILPIFTVMNKTDEHLIEAAEDLGANGFEVFRRVRFPLSLPGICSGIIMVFMPAVTTFTVSRLLGGSNFMLYGDAIEMQFFFVRDWNFGAALSLVMMVLLLLTTFLLQRNSNDRAGGGMLW